MAGMARSNKEFRELGPYNCLPAFLLGQHGHLPGGNPGGSLGRPPGGGSSLSKDKGSHGNLTIHFCGRDDSYDLLSFGNYIHTFIYILRMDYLESKESCVVLRGGFGSRFALYPPVEQATPAPCSFFNSEIAYGS